MTKQTTIVVIGSLRVNVLIAFYLSGNNTCTLPVTCIVKNFTVPLAWITKKGYFNIYLQLLQIRFWYKEHFTSCFKA